MKRTIDWRLRLQWSRLAGFSAFVLWIWLVVIISMISWVLEVIRNPIWFIVLCNFGRKKFHLQEILNPSNVFVSLLLSSILRFKKKLLSSIQHHCICSQSDSFFHNPTNKNKRFAVASNSFSSKNFFWVGILCSSFEEEEPKQ